MLTTTTWGSRYLRQGALALALTTAACSVDPPDPEPIGTAASPLVVTGLFSTGVNAAGVPLAVGAVDPHYVLSSNDPGFPGPNALAVTPAGGWTGNTATSDWISIQASTQGIGTGIYVYTTTFTLAGVNPATATLSGTWSCDDSCTVALNGTPVAADGTPAWGGVKAFTVPAGSPFQLGTNTLVFTVPNATGGPTGLQVVTLTGNVSGCDLDSQCAAADFCDTATATCVPKLANGTPVPTIPGHTPPLSGTCTPAAGSSVCISGVCDTIDNACGYADGDGPCTAGDGGTVCRSGACSTDGTCEPAGGCNVDADCTGGKWCNEGTHTCTPQIPNGGAIPSDPPHTSPTLNGTCSPSAATLVCVSGVCDPSDNDCGYANGDGPCTAGDGGTVCRSGACSTDGTCEPAGGCNVDADCTGGDWCDESTHTCTPQIPNGGAIPSDPPHTSPTLNGTCSAQAGALVCVSGVCDPGDNDCGYANGDGPCTTTNGSTVCRSGQCSPNAGVCVPAGGCAVDADCAAGDWCDNPTFTCVPKIPNGSPVPTVPGHAPPLDGTCTPAAGSDVCVSGVCDPSDDDCGYANGDGPCTAGNGGTVCRSGACSTTGTCEPPGGCNVDADCATGNWCDETTHTCEPQVANGVLVPTDPAHNDPTLNGTCSPAAGTLVCQSGVCDTVDNECGYADGDGPCTATSGMTVCRSGNCATTGPGAGTCVACVTDAQCSGATPACDQTTNTCVQCTNTNATACAGATPLCDTGSSTCVPCNGDLGSGATEPCGTVGNPFCFLTGTGEGTCGMCTMDSQCVGHPSGNTCNTTTGTCYQACHSDADCSSTDWCNAPTGGAGTCVPKLANGTPLPTAPTNVATCSTTVGMRVCVSGVCDPKDNACGYLAGDGPCAGNAECRNMTCDTGTMVCTAPSSGCTTDAGCPAGDFCDSGACVPRLPVGAVCAGSDQCASADCASGVCATGLIASGNGLLCAARDAGSSRGDGAAAIFGLMLAAAGLRRGARQGRR